MLTACTSEDDLLQTGQTKQSATQEVGFDVYTPAATNTTRAGLVGTMTTNRLQLSEGEGGGFGVYAYLTEDILEGAGDAAANATAYTGGKPNFMVNEKILWNNTNLGWYYNPLKYWPNETDNDSQATPAYMESDQQTTPPTYDNMHLDRLTFFAYAPYVPGDAGTTGITAITTKAGELNSTAVTNPTIAWTASDTPDTDFNPNQGVDLLWGVAPAGGLSYTAVNGWTVSRDEGTPLLNMIKPDVNTSMKFLFQHALARFGINVVAAVDQVSPGGELDPNTKITIESLKITGPFGTTGNLDLNNGTKASVANWTLIGGTPTSGASSIPANNGTILVGANTTNKAIAANLRWKKDGSKPHEVPVAQTVVGVSTAKQDLLAPSTKWYNKLASKPDYDPAKIYYTYDGSSYTEAKAEATYDGLGGYYELSGNNYNKVAAGTISSPDFPEAVAVDYFTLVATTFTAGNEPTGDDDTKLYTTDGTDYTYAGTKSEVATALAAASKDWSTNPTAYCTLVATAVLLKSISFAYPDGTYYQAERNYLYVVPTNAALDSNFGAVVSGDEESLRTITLQIEYYISTEDGKLKAERAETKNVITKTVVLPSLANGKTYMLNLVLGLTSVKVEAEVDDWKVVNVQADLPQNTAE